MSRQASQLDQENKYEIQQNGSVELSSINSTPSTTRLLPQTRNSDADADDMDLDPEFIARAFIQKMRSGWRYVTPNYKHKVLKEIMDLKVGDLKVNITFTEDEQKIYERAADIIYKIKKGMADYRKFLQDSGYQTLQEIADETDWKQDTKSLSTKHIAAGEYWYSQNLQEAVIAQMTLLGKASQCDELLFAALNIITGVKGLMTIFGNEPWKIVLYSLTLGFAGVFGTFPDVFGINPSRQAEKGVKPECKFEIKHFKTLEQADFYLNALRLNKTFKEPMKPWKKHAIMTLVDFAAFGISYPIAWASAKSVSSDTTPPSSEIWIGSVAFTSIFALLNHTGYLLKFLRKVTPLINFFCFILTILLGALAQYIPIGQLYNYESLPAIASLALGLAFYALLYRVVLKNSKISPIKKYGLAIIWFLLCSSLVIKKPSQAVLAALSVAWAFGFFGPVGMTYYNFLSRETSDNAGDNFWTTENPIYQLCLISPSLGGESTAQLLVNCLRRAGTFTGILGEYALAAFLVETTSIPEWAKYLTLAIALISSIVTRIQGLPNLDSFMVISPYSIKFPVPSMKLFEDKGTISKFRPSSTQKALSTLYAIGLGAGIGLYLSSGNGPFYPLLGAGLSGLALGLINYWGQNRQEHAAILHKKITNETMLPDDAKKAEQTDRLERGGMRLAVSTLVSNSLSRMLGTAAFIAGIGLLISHADRLELDNFYTVWLASLLISILPSFNEARVTLHAEVLPTAKEVVETSENYLLEARKNPPTAWSEQIKLSLYRGFYYVFGDKLPEDQTQKTLELAPLGDEDRGTPIPDGRPTVTPLPLYVPSEGYQPPAVNSTARNPNRLTTTQPSINDSEVNIRITNNLGVMS